jgi:hypothetical protein
MIQTKTVYFIVKEILGHNTGHVQKAEAGHLGNTMDTPQS